MSEKKSISIEKENNRPVSLDFKLLREQGINLVQKLSGHVWTDYNLHDPGVTILELLCTAITDLAYRTEFPIKDLLSDKDGNIASKDNAFFTKEEILTTNPITVHDFQMALQDEIEEVYNVWLEPMRSRHSPEYVKGVYRIYVQMTREAASKKEDREKVINRIKDQVKRSFVSKRNLCEDWERDIVILDPTEIKVNADILVTGDTKSEEVLAKVYSHLENYMNPPVKYYSEGELLKENFKIEDIFVGPLLKKGFIPEAKMSFRREIIDPEEIIEQIMQIDGVINVINLSLQTSEGNTGFKPFRLNEFNFPYLVNNMNDPSIKIIKGKNTSLIETGIFQDLLLKEREISRRSFISSFHTYSNPDLFKGNYRDVAHYYSIQNHFPTIYNIGAEGLPSGETKDHKARAKQLKSYLMLFEQILANYLSQLAHSKDLFSIRLSGPGANTYYYQPLYDIPDVKKQLKAFTAISKSGSEEEWKLFKKNENNDYMRFLREGLEDQDTYRERKNRVFDHLLARFNWPLDFFPVNLFHSLYGDPAMEEKKDEILDWKSDIINNLVELSHDRIRAIDYLATSKDLEAFKGFHKRLAKLLYIHKLKRRPLSWVFDLKKGEQDGEEQVHSLAWMGKTKPDSHAGKEPRDSQSPNFFDFGDQTTEIFKNGIDINNYKIEPASKNLQYYYIKYKNPEEKQWNKISEKYADPLHAKASLLKLINYLKDINIESEGFHIVEHVLLRPALKSNSFGFGFFENKDKCLFHQKQWHSFMERENILAGIAESGTGDENSSQLLKDLQMLQDRENRFYPRYTLWTKVSDDFVIKEDYFDYRMSVVLPSWPARFQDGDFRAFVMGLFRINAPAHIRINFLWLNITEMKKFEKIYFDWLYSFRIPGNEIADKSLSEKLIHILNGTDYRVSGI